MPSVTLWSGFTKRVNSTKRPTSTGTTYSMDYKAGCSLENPVYTLSSSAAVYNYDYAYADGHYYWITDIVRLRQNMYEIHCAQDVLATYKDDIGAATTFVERAASKYDAYLPDSALSVSNEIQEIAHYDTALTSYEFGGCICARIISSDGCGVYAFQESQFAILIAYTFTADNTDVGEVITDEAVKAFFNPFQYIVDVFWMPFTAASMGSYTTGIKVGWFTTTAEGYLVSEDAAFNYSIAFSELKPSTITYTDFRRYSNSIVKTRAYVPGIGKFDIDSGELAEANAKLVVTIDKSTGKIRATACHTYKDENGLDYIYDVFAMQEGRIGVSLQIGQVGASLGSATSNIISSISGDGLLGNAAGALLGTVAAPITAILGGLSGGPTVVGNADAIALIRQIPYIIISQAFNSTEDFPLSNYGRPLMRNWTLGELSGFIKCGNASIPIAGLESDRAAVNNYLNGGFYYE